MPSYGYKWHYADYGNAPGPWYLATWNGDQNWYILNIETDVKIHIAPFSAKGKDWRRATLEEANRRNLPTTIARCVEHGLVEMDVAIDNPGWPENPLCPTCREKMTKERKAMK